MSRPGVARNITLDQRTGDVWIDDRRLGAAVAADWRINDFRGMHGVTLTILTDSAQVHRHLDDDLAWIRQLADLHRHELGLTTPTPPTTAPREDMSDE